MDYGLCLPNFREGASREGMESAAETTERLGWSTVWTTDHILVANEDTDDYGRIYEAILSLTWIGAKFTKVRLLTARAYTQFGPATDKFYAIRGSVEEMADEVRAFEALGVSHLALWFDATDPAEVSALAERFAQEVAPLV